MKIKSHLQLKARFLGAVLVLSLVPAYAQYTKASLSGTVADSSGALLSAAAVTVESRETGYRQQQPTSSQGTFLFPELRFNLFNNVNFNNPGRIVSATDSFGTITSAKDPRIIQFALKILF